MTQKPDPAAPALPHLLNILVVEDSPFDAELLLHELQRAGLNVRMDVAKTAVEVVAFLLGGSYDVVLSDFNLRGWTGLDALQLLRERRPDLPFILVTGSLGDEKTAECIKLGATDFVLKDRLNRLPHAVTRALEERRLRQERERAEEARMASLARSQALLSALAEIVYEWWPKAGKVLWEGEYTRILGYTQEEIGRDTASWTSRVHPEDLPAVLREIETAKNKRRLYDLEYRFRRRDGTYAWMHDRGVLTLDEEGNLERVLGVFSEISLRKDAEKHLVQMEGRYRGLLEAAPDAMVVVNEGGEIVLLNAQTEKQFGYRRDELVGQKVKNIIPEGFAERLIADGTRSTAEALAQQIGTGIVLSGRRRDGSEFPIEIMLSPLESAEGILVTAAIRNISERRQLEQQFRQAQKMEAIGQLAGGVAHDFNNLLMVISSFTEMMVDVGAMNEKQQRYRDEVLKATRRAAGLTQQLLAFSRKQLLAPSVLDLNSVANDFAKMLPPLIGEHIEVRLLTNSQNGKVEADLGQIEQILMNLAVNARDAMPKGGTLVIEVADAVFDQDRVGPNYIIPAGSYVQLAVSDNGEGMARNTLEHIFEPFFTTKAMGKGTGLGLSTVYGIVKQSGGYISAYSEPGVGTTFKIYLPRMEEPAAPQPAKPEPSTTGGSETILLVEDEQALRIAAREFLKMKGYAVLEAADGTQGLRVHAQHTGRVHLLITDVIMPGGTGPELAEKLQRRDKRLQVLYISGYTGGSVGSMAKLQQGASFLQKPFTLEFLARKVRAILDAAGKVPAPPSSQGANP